MTFILNTDYNLRPKINIFKIIAIAVILIICLIFIKFKPAYSVMLGDEQIGYVNNKIKFQEKIDNEVLKSSENNVAFVALDNVSYCFEFVDRNLISDEKTIAKVKENSSNIYFVYEVSDGNDENAVYVNSLNEARSLVDTLKANYKDIDPNLQITTLYLEETVTEEAIIEAKAKITNELDAKLKEKQEKDKRTVNGIYLACIPVTSGTISSRYGSRESVRDHAHGGLDIAANYGTEIKASADGKVKFAGFNNGGYGNLVILEHGNGVETYYGHCSRVLVSAGAEVKAGDVIAKVGSTGNSTGNHLHFEIRINGVAVNPQKYIY